MSSVSRRTVLQALGGTGMSALAGTAATGLVHAGSAAAGSSTEPLFTFVSMPDFFNGDVADLSALPDFDDHESNSSGMNSWNEDWQAAIDRCLGAIAGHRPDAVFLAGDMVEGRWNIDSDDRRLFGPVSQGTDPEAIARCKAAISSASGVYYPFAADLFARRNLALYPAVGDHEILDDRSGPLNSRWSPSGFHGGVPDNRYYLVKHSKRVWADHFTRPGGKPRFHRRPRGTAAEFSAYAVSFADSLTLITVDMFTHHSGGVRLGVFHAQLQWLRDEIRHAKRRGHTVVVQGHIPIMWPSRWMASGRLRVPEGRDSALYKVLDREGADLYLCGEVHDSTAVQHRRHSLLQISHGCIFRYGCSYLVGRLYPDRRLVLDLFEIPVVRASREDGLWSSDVKKRQRTFIEYGAPVHRGRLVQRDREVLRRTAKLGPYDPRHDRFDLRGRLGTVLV
jgi:hypothetical protein